MNKKLYRTWADMKQRCRNKKSNNYKYYGAKGVDYTDEWESYKNFEKWALENGFSKDLSIDRINVYGNYEPSNCRWSTRKQQDNNKRNSIKSIINGEELTLKEISEKYKIGYSCLRHRYSVGDRGEKLIGPYDRGNRRNGEKKIRGTRYEDKAFKEVRWLVNNTEMNQKDIGKLYNMSQAYVSRVKRGMFEEKGEIKPQWYK